MIAIIAILSLLVVLATLSYVRAGGRPLDMRRDRSIDQDLVEGRLIRIEEAIDAMALQIERLTEHQRAVLGGREPSLPPDDPHRTEHPG
jgi:hypothetical protein